MATSSYFLFWRSDTEKPRPALQGKTRVMLSALWAPLFAGGFTSNEYLGWWQPNSPLPDDPAEPVRLVVKKKTSQMATWMETLIHPVDWHMSSYTVSNWDAGKSWHLNMGVWMSLRPGSPRGMRSSLGKEWDIISNPSQKFRTLGSGLCLCSQKQ